MSESNSVRVSLVQRTSFDTAAALNMLVLLTTGQTLRNQVGYTQSQTLRTDANVQDLVRLSLSTGGGLPVEMQFPVVNEALWFLLRAVMRATETAESNNASSLTLTGSPATFNKPGVDFTGVIEPGDIVKISASPGGANDGYRKVTAVAAGAGGLVTVAGPAFSSAATCTVVRGARMKNGTQRNFFDVEVSRLDASLHELFTKVAVDGLTLTVSDNAITSAAFNLLGITSQRTTEASAHGLSYTDPTSGPILDALGVPVFNVGDVAFSAKSIGFSIANNVRARTQVGTLGGTAFSFGAFTVTTRQSSYYANFTEISNYFGNVPGDMWFVLQNSSSQSLSFAFPQHKWADLAADTRGLNQDDYLEGSGQAYLHPTQLCTMRVQRWVA